MSYPTKGIVVYLKKNEAYFDAAFYDKNLKIPCIETYIFTGVDEEDGYIFQDAEDETTQICFPLDKMDGIYDKKALSEWLLEDHSPKYPSYETITYKII